VVCTSKRIFRTAVSRPQNLPVFAQEKHLMIGIGFGAAAVHSCAKQYGVAGYEKLVSFFLGILHPAHSQG